MAEEGEVVEPDYYAVLQVEPAAEPVVIDAAYRALARIHHPDVNRSPDAPDRIRLLNEAYRVLRDPKARADYNARRWPQATMTGPASNPTDATVEVAAVIRRVRLERPVDLFAAAVVDAWRCTARSLGARRRAAGPGRARVEAVGNGGVAGERRQDASDRFTWTLLIVTLLVGLGIGTVAGMVSRPWLAGAEARSTATYWRGAVGARAGVEEARQRFAATPGATTGAIPPAAAYAAAVGNTAYGSLATQLIAELEIASVRLRQVQQVPAPAESFHFMQLDDWREEREIRIAQRDAVLARSPELWAQAVERETSWRASPQHRRAEAAAWQLAALVGR